MAKSWSVVPAVLLLTVAAAQGTLLTFGHQSDGRANQLNNSLTANAVRTETRAAGTQLSSAAGEQNISRSPQCTVQASSKISTAVEPRVMMEKQKIKEKLEEFDQAKNWMAVKQYLETLVDHSGAVFRQLQTVSHAHPMYSVATNRFTELAAVLVVAGRGANVSDSNGNTLLHGASDSGYLQLAEFVLRHGADPNQRNMLGFTPLMRAAWWNHLDVARLLLEKGANASSADLFGETSLHHAAYWGNVDMAQLLVCAGADPMAVKRDGTTAISSALSLGHVTVAEYLSQLPH